MRLLLIAKSLSLFQTLWCWILVLLCCPACLCYLGADLRESIASNSNPDSWSVPLTSPYYPVGSVAGCYELLNVKSALATAVFLFTAVSSRGASDFTPRAQHLMLIWAAFCCWSRSVFGAWFYLPPSSYPRHLPAVPVRSPPALIAFLASPKELRSSSRLVSPLFSNLNSLVNTLLSPCRFFWTHILSW